MNRTDQLAQRLLQMRVAESFDPADAAFRDRLDRGNQAAPPERGWDDKSDRYNDDDSFDDDPNDKTDENELKSEDSIDLTDFDEPDRGETHRKTRLKLLAGMIYAQLGDPAAVVEEARPNELTVRVQDLSWKVVVDDQGRVSVSGFDSGADQLVGKLPEENAENAIVRTSENVHRLISEDIDRKSVPTEPPVRYGPAEDLAGPEEGMAGSSAGPPVAPGGDQGMDLAAQGPGEVPQDMAPLPGAAAPGNGGFGAPAGAPGMGVPGGGPPGAPTPPPGTPGVGAPVASRRRAGIELIQVVDRLKHIGAGLDKDGQEAFDQLAMRIKMISNAFKQTRD